MKDKKYMKVPKNLYYILINDGLTLRETRVIACLIARLIDVDARKINNYELGLRHTDLVNMTKMDKANITYATKSLLAKNKIKKIDRRYYLK